MVHHRFFREGQVGFGLVTYRRRGRLGPRRQAHYQLVAIHQGSVRLAIDGIEHRIGAGEAILLERGHEEHFRFSDERATTHSWCQLSPEVLPSFFTIPPVAIGRPARCQPWLLDFMRNGWKMPAESKTPSGSQAILSAVLCAMAQFCSGFPEAAPGKKPLPDSLRKARQLMDSRVAEAMTLEGLARQAGLSKGHFIKLAKEHWKMTPMERFWQIRVETAARLLRETGLSVSEIAYRTGFANPFHFSRRFRRRFDESPRIWRRKIWGSGVSSSSS